MAQPLPPQSSLRPHGDFVALLQSHWYDFLADNANYYSLPSMAEFAVGVGVAAIPANTKMDNNFRDWYQNDVRSPTSDRIAAFWKPFGEGLYTIPACAAAELLGGYFSEYPLMDTVGQFGNRSIRAYMIGTVPMLVMQEILGSGRPSDTADNSYWHPFAHPNGVSGHAFIGSVPFITAAQMSDNPLEKGFFYACSMMTAWSRINDDAHYLSEAALGWWMGYLACQAVNNTDLEKRQIMVQPMITPEMSGVGVVYQH